MRKFVLFNTKNILKYEILFKNNNFNVDSLNYQQNID